LNCKAALVKQCRILDLRSLDEYASGHIPNAVHVPLPTNSPTPWLSVHQVSDLLNQADVQGNMQVVIYDEHSGLDATWLWWHLIKAGHPFAAVLDGGLTNWQTSGYSISRARPKIGSGKNELSQLGDTPSTDFEISAAKPFSWDWTNANGPDGLKNAEDLGHLLRESGVDEPGLYRAKGSPKEAVHLLFILRLLGWRAQVLRAEGDDCFLQIHAEA
jgi:rhodanese-related sulfurtransferase